MNLIDTVSKIVTASFWILWLLVVTGLVRTIEALDPWIILLGWIILGLHILETGIYSVRAKDRGGFKIADAAQVLVFGVFHLIPVSFSDKK